MSKIKEESLYNYLKAMIPTDLEMKGSILLNNIDLSKEDIINLYSVMLNKSKYINELIEIEQQKTKVTIDKFFKQILSININRLGESLTIGFLDDEWNLTKEYWESLLTDNYELEKIGLTKKEAAEAIIRELKLIQSKN